MNSGSSSGGGGGGGGGGEMGWESGAVMRGDGISSRAVDSDRAKSMACFIEEGGVAIIS